jgi:hypothetical protein
MAVSTRNTVVGVFGDEKTAQAVADEVLGLGVARVNVHLGNQGETQDAPEGGVIGWLESFFGSQADDDHRNVYAEAAKRGNYVLAVDTDETNEDRIVEIMQRGALVDVDRHFTDYLQREQPAADREMSYDAAVSYPDSTADPDEKLGLEMETQPGRRFSQRGGLRVYGPRSNRGELL